MSRKTHVDENPRLVEKTCPECGGKGTVVKIVRYNKPSGVAYEPTGVLDREEKRKVSCVRCGGRGKITFWTTDEIES